MKTKDQIETEREKITAESVQFISRLEKQLELAQSQRLTDDFKSALKVQISQARASYDGILDRLDIEFAAALERETLEKAEKQAKQIALASQTREELKSKLRSAWLEAGGDEEVFDGVFPSLYQAEMEKRTLLKAGLDSKANLDVIRKSF
jgi:hypothetical protein